MKTNTNLDNQVKELEQRLDKNITVGEKNFQQIVGWIKKHEKEDRGIFRIFD